jgi:hypothetical protein
VPKVFEVPKVLEVPKVPKVLKMSEMSKVIGCFRSENTKTFAASV